VFGLCHGKIPRVLEDDHEHEHESSTVESRSGAVGLGSA
jgi:hypothetical protein